MANVWTPARLEKLIAMRLAGTTSNEIGAHFGISAATVRGLLKRQGVKMPKEHRTALNRANGRQGGCIKAKGTGLWLMEASPLAGDEEQVREHAEQANRQFMRRFKQVAIKRHWLVRDVAGAR